MMILDAQDSTFKFNGVTVGKITQYTFADGAVDDIVFDSVTSSAKRSFPGNPEYGSVTLTLYRDTDDLGQQEMAKAIGNRLIAPIDLVLDNGRQFFAEAYVKTMPITGLIDNVNTSQVVLKLHSSLIES